MGRTIIVGAGLCGLVAARTCRDEGGGVLVLESGGYPGGVIRSELRDGYLIEHGPNSLALRAGHAPDYLEQVGLLEDAIEANPEANKRFIVRGGQPVAVPSSASSFITSSLFSTLGKLRLLLEPLLPRGSARKNESVADFFMRRLGREVRDYAANPFIAGVYSARPETLVLRHAFPAIYELEGKHRSLMLGGIKAAKRRKREGLPKTRLVSFKKGLAELPNRLAEELGNDLRLNAPVRKISRDGDTWRVAFEEAGKRKEERANRIVCSVPAHALESIEWEGLAESDSLKTLASAHHYPIAVVQLGFPREDVGHPLDGFGFLVPEKENLRILGTLFSSTLFPERAPEGHVLLTTFVGGERQPDLTEKSDEELYELVLEELQGLLEVRETPTFRNLVRWPKAIPLPDSGQDDRLAAAKRLQDANPGLILSGSHLTGVSLPACLEGTESLLSENG
jgi:oxygen-dependent protoporphyrinogen oxidase